MGRKKNPQRFLYKSFRCSEPLYEEIEQAAEQSEMNVSEFIREALVCHIKKLEKKGFYDPPWRRREVVNVKR